MQRVTILILDLRLKNLKTSFCITLYALFHIRLQDEIMKNGVFWDVTPLRTLRRNTNLVFLRSMRRLLVATSVIPSSPILVTPMKEALGSSETSVLKEPHGVISQKTPFFIVTAVKTSNLRRRDQFTQT
jgi:hypothetical protein